MTPAARIRAAIAAFPGSTTELAQGLGVSRSLLYAWVKGERVATEEDAERLVTLACRITRDALTRLEALHVDLDDEPETESERAAVDVARDDAGDGEP